MQNLQKQYGRVTVGTPASVARTARRYPAPQANAADDAFLRAGHATDRTELDALVLRTFAGSGFGDAVIDTTVAPAPVTSFDLYHLARAHRSYQLREIVKALLQAVTDAVQPVITRWRQKQQARAAYRTLQALDTRTLRDLGFDRSELMSVATELATGGSSTRVRI
jgi:uncharacterized protein YjiS (DUF1127 family)